MISLTRRELDTVSALTAACLEARGPDRLERLGLRPEATKAEAPALETAPH